MSVMSPPTTAPSRSSRPTVNPHPNDRRLVGAGLTAASLAMLTGAAFWASTGVDLDGAAETRTVHEILPAIAANATGLTITLVAWLLGMTLYGITVGGLSRMSSPSRLPSIAAGLLGFAIPVVASAYVTFLVLIHVVAATPAADPVLANAVGFYGTYADWFATPIVAGVVPALLALEGRGDWAPRWLIGLAVAALAASAATVIALVTGSGLTTFGFAVVPVGMALTLSLGIVLWRRG